MYVWDYFWEMKCGSNSAFSYRRAKVYNVKDNMIIFYGFLHFSCAADGLPHIFISHNRSVLHNVWAIFVDTFCDKTILPCKECLIPAVCSTRSAVTSVSLTVKYEVNWFRLSEPLCSCFIHYLNGYSAPIPKCTATTRDTLKTAGTQVKEEIHKYQ